MSLGLCVWRVQSGRSGQFRFHENLTRHFLWTYCTLRNALDGGRCPNIFAEVSGEGVSEVVILASNPRAQLDSFSKGGSGRDAHEPALAIAWASASLGLRELGAGEGGAKASIFLVFDHDFVCLHLVHFGNPRGKSACKDVVRILTDRRESHFGFHIPFLCCRFCKRGGS